MERSESIEPHERGGGRKSAYRWLAPLAIVAVAVAALMVVSGASVEERDQTQAPGAASQGVTDVSESQPSGSGKRYVVKPGDTLTAIAEKTGVPLDQLLALNPEIDPQSLAAGQRLKLR